MSSEFRRPLAHSPPFSMESLPGKKSKSSSPQEDQENFLPAVPLDLSPEPARNQADCDMPNGFLQPNAGDLKEPESIFECEVPLSTNSTNSLLQDCHADGVQLQLPPRFGMIRFENSGGFIASTNDADDAFGPDGDLSSDVESDASDRRLEIDDAARSGFDDEDNALSPITSDCDVSNRSASTKDLSSMMDDFSVNSPKPPQSQVTSSANACEDAPPKQEDIQLSVMSVSHDWNEDPNRRLSGFYFNLFLNGVIWAEAEFAERSFMIRLRTRDVFFLKMRGEDYGVETIFAYKSGVLFAEICPDKCKMSFTEKGIEVYVEKVKEEYWTDLKAPANIVANYTHSQHSQERTHVSVIYDDVVVKKPTASVAPKSRSKSPLRNGRSSPINDGDTSDEDGHQKSLQLGGSRRLPPAHTLKSGGGGSYWLGNLFSRSASPPALLTRGMTGLNNVGNSCYLSAVVQCLANTRELRDYLIGGDFVAEVNAENAMGTRGEFAEIVAATFRNLWSGARPSFSPNRLRSVMGRLKEQFSTMGQQDAQEAMTLIIDTLHEDLNRVHKKPYLEEIPCENRSDEVIAKETWNYFVSRENSAVYDLFTGMYKSTVECPDCNTKSVKFDPYQCMAVPVPKIGIVLECVFISRKLDAKWHQFRINFNVEHSIGQHYAQIQTHLGETPVANVMMLTSTMDGKISMEIHKNTECRSLLDDTVLIIFEILTEKTAKEPVKTFLIQQFNRVPDDALPAGVCAFCRASAEPSMLKCEHCFSVEYCSKECKEKGWILEHKLKCAKTIGRPVHFPFYVSFRESQLQPELFYCTVAKLAKKFVSCRKWKPKINARAVSKDGKTSADSSTPIPTEFEWKDWNVEEDYRTMMTTRNRSYPFQLLPVDLLRGPWELYPKATAAVQNIERVKTALEKYSKFVLLWSNHRSTLELGRADLQPYLQPDASWTALQDAHRKESANLYECVDLLTQPEILSRHNAWICPSCKQPKEAFKKFEIWSLPTVLIFQLKRFTAPSRDIWRRDKIDTKVEYPVEALDMAPFRVGPGDGGQFLYDLYGVVSHRGSTWFGHYCAHARCYNVPDSTTEEIGWRSFDDETVEMEDHIEHGEGVVNRGAYLLFYRRRGVDNPIHLDIGMHGCDEEEDESDRSAFSQGTSLSPAMDVFLSPTRMINLLATYCNVL